MTELTVDDFADRTPAELMKLLRSTSDAQLREAMGGERRRPILDAVFGRMPELFRPDRAGPTRAVIHWNLTGRPDGGTDRYQLAIDSGTCTVGSAFDRDPQLTATLGAAEFLKLISGRANPTLMVLTGKIRVAGDLGLASGITKLFDYPQG